MEPIRILQVVDSLYSGSGALCSIMNSYRHIDHSKVQYDFLYFQDSPQSYKNEILELGGRIYSIQMPRMSNLKSILGFVHDVDLFFQIHSKEYKAVHLHVILLNSIILSKAKKYGVLFRIIHCHSTKYSGGKLKSLRNYLLCLPIKKYANIFFAASKAAGKFLFGKKMVEDNKVIISIGIDTDLFDFDKNIREQVRKELNLRDNIILGHVGRFNIEKNHSFLIDIFLEVRKLNPNSKLLLVGDGPLQKHIADKVIYLGLKDHVLFLGLRNDVPRLFQAMDILVFPSKFEGFGLVVAEAICAGVKCFISDKVPVNINFPRLLQSISLKKDAKFWATCILDSLTLQQERKSGVEIIKKFSLDSKNTAKKLQEFYMNL